MREAVREWYGRYQFHIGRDEYEEGRDWLRLHSCSWWRKMLKRGQEYKYSWILSPAGIGTVVVIRCDWCGKQKDVTNVEKW